MNHDEWVAELFRCVDTKDSGAWLDLLAPDACFRFGNAAVVEGRDSIRETVTAFFTSISALRHDVLETWHHPNAVICRGDVTYTRLDGSSLTVPFANVLKLHGDLIREYLVYADTSELYRSSAC